MQGLADELFPGTALAIYQHAAVSSGHQFHLLAQRCAKSSYGEYLLSVYNSVSTLA